MLHIHASGKIRIAKSIVRLVVNIGHWKTNCNTLKAAAENKLLLLLKFGMPFNFAPVIEKKEE